MISMYEEKITHPSFTPKLHLCSSTYAIKIKKTLMFFTVFIVNDYCRVPKNNNAGCPYLFYFTNVDLWIDMVYKKSIK